MVKVTKIALNPQDKTAFVSLFADAKSDVTSDMKVDGMPDGYTLDAGSSILTADGEVAFVKSDGTINWL